MISHIWKLRLWIARRSKLRKIDSWFEHATFWSGVSRATVAPRSHLARMEDSDIAEHAIQHQAELENIAQNIE